MCKITEIFVLKGMLKASNIPFDFIDWNEQETYKKYQIGYPTKDASKIVCSIIEGFGTYGSEEDKLEIMGLLTAEEEDGDSVLGYLMADEVFARINRHFINENNI